jgi:hypothetical protein
MKILFATIFLILISVLTDEVFKKLYKETFTNIKGMWDSY